MSNNRWDGSLNGINYRLVRGGEAYNRFFSRQTIEENLLSVGSGMTSRTDRRKFYQTDWSGGSSWSRPLLTPENSNTYMYSRGMDVWSEPGKIWPINETFYLSMASKGMGIYSPVTTAPPLLGTAQTSFYGITNSPFNLRYWRNDTAAWTTSTGTIGNSGNHWQLIYHQADSYFYAFNSTYISYTDGTITTGDDAIAVTPSFGASLLPPLAGTGSNMYFYDGDILHKINDTRTALETVTDDGLGPDILSDIPEPTASDPMRPRHQRLAISTAEGIYYAKNIWSTSGIPQAWVFRVERDSAGNTISVPLATLPVGNVALSIGYAYGNPVILATNEWGRALQNDRHFKTQLWSIFGGTLGLLGSFYIRDPDFLHVSDPQETVLTVLGSYNNMLALGSTYGIRVYDPIRGGMHMFADTNPESQSYAMFWIPEWQTGVGAWVTESTYWYDPLDQNYYTVYGASNNYNNRIWSNWFDFGLPGEQKTITKIRTRLGEYDWNTNDEWWVTIYDADGTEYDADINSNPHEHRYGQLGADLTYESDWNLTSEKFQYSIAFTRLTGATSTDPTHLVGIWITAETGDPVQGWQLRIDGTVFENVEGIRQNPQDVYDSWVTLGQNMTPITLVDGFEGYDRSESSSHRVRIQSVSISKGDPNESYVDVTLVEA